MTPHGCYLAGSMSEEPYSRPQEKGRQGNRKREDADVASLRRAQERRFAPRVNRVGQVFHELTVVKLDQDRSARERRTFWVCSCSCSRSVSVREGRLVSGYTKSCGHTRPGGVPKADVVSALSAENENLRLQLFSANLKIKELERTIAVARHREE